MTFKQDGNKFYGNLDYETITDNGLKISIGSIFSLSESHVYFDWGLEKCGFGQYSISYDSEQKKWTIMNECMGPDTSFSILKALEESIIASGDQKAIYFLNKIISIISYQSKSLAKSILLIWDSAEKEGGESTNFEKTIKEYKKILKKELKVEKNMLSSSEDVGTEDLKLYSITTNHYSYSNKQGSFYEVSLDLFFDIKNLKYGFLSVTQRTDLNSGDLEWIVNEGIDVKVLSQVIKMLESITGDHNKIWNVWKSAVKIKGGPVKMSSNILDKAKFKKTRYCVK